MGKASRQKRELRRGELANVPHENVKPSISESGNSICDFCASPDVKWGYPSQNDPSEPGGEGGWAACDACHDLIERGRHEELTERAVNAQIILYPVLAQVPRKRLREEFKELHDIFRRARSGQALTHREYNKKYGPGRKSHLAQFIEDQGLGNLLAGDTHGGIPVPAGSPILHPHQIADGVMEYMNEGFTPEQLTDPRTVEYMMKRITADRPVPKIPLATPFVDVIKEWVGARTYKEACAAIYGETPRADDMFTPRPPMIMAQKALEPIMRAHPVVIEPGQMNMIDEGDWSFAEANDYAKMAHLPFEPIYLDFGGRDQVIVDLKYGPCRLHGAVIWRSGFFKTPTLAVAPIGGFDYLTGPFADAMLEAGIDQDKVVGYVGSRPGKEIHEGDLSVYGSASQRKAMGPLYRFDQQHHNQWQYQMAGICWFGIKTKDIDPPFVTMEQEIMQDRGSSKVELVFSTEEVVAQVTDSPRERVQANILSGMWGQPDVSRDDDGFKTAEQWVTMMEGATEMVAKLTERALLGLYFLENAPVNITEVPLSRPEKREMHRKRQKGRDPGQIASIVVIKSNRSSGSRTENLGDRHYTHRWERRGHFQHIHENNRQYQNRPDMVKPCHKCSYEHNENVKALREGREMPYPNTESPDCIKRWIDLTVCGPEDLPLKKKVRVRRKDQEAA